MLQQTRVEAALPYFEAWMRKFPDLEALAAAELEDVLQVWAGLGYYARARNLHRAAREVVIERGGELPRDPEGLRSLPGVGEYTAAAVSSIAFGAPVAAVDGNIRRVLARLLDHPSPTPANQREWATKLLAREDPGAFNQALMELGALLCTPRSPRCSRCPVSSFCRSYAAGTQEERPAARARRAASHLTEAVAVILGARGGEPFVLVRKRPPEGLLGGLWELPGIRVAEGVGSGEAARRLAEELLSACGWESEGGMLHDGTPLEPLDHVFTHRRIRYIPYLFRPRGLDELRTPIATLLWIAPPGGGGVPFPAAQRTLLERVAEALSAKTFSPGHPE